MNTCTTYIHTVCKLIKLSFLSLFLLPLLTFNAWASGCNVATFSSLVPPGDAANVVINSAIMVPAAGTLPSYCDVLGAMDTASTSVINVEFRLPSPWNNKLYMAGMGGFAGSLPTVTGGDSEEALSKNFVIAGTDTGHATSTHANPTWALNNPLGQINYGYRAIHLTALLSKEAIAAYYRLPARYSYFDGCSNGGRQGLMEAQRYPTDFNGIIAGDPVYDLTHLLLKFTQVDQAQYPDGNFLNPVIAPGKLNLLTTTVLNKCDALDGIKDGIINNPLACNFNPAIDLPRCRNNVDGPACFTSQQVNALNTIYNGVLTADLQFYPGYFPGAESTTAFGSGTDWPGFVFGSTAYIPILPTTAHPAGVPSEDILFSDGVFDNFINFAHLTQPVSYLDFNLFNKQDVSDLLSIAPILNATNPNLSAFNRNGGKLIMYNGWNDPAESPLSTIAYYSVVALLNGGLSNTENFARLFMAPGMLHCGNGPGPNTFDRLTALDNWVTNGVAPASMIATNATDGISRPLCPFPQIAVLNHGLDPTNPTITNNAANFHCAY